VHQHLDESFLVVLTRQRFTHQSVSLVLPETLKMADR
jgi:hypothetical protein